METKAGKPRQVPVKIMTAYRVLVKARDRIAHKENWCQNAYAKYDLAEAGVPGAKPGMLGGCSPEAADAKCWCATGSVRRELSEASKSLRLRQEYNELIYALLAPEVPGDFLTKRGYPGLASTGNISVHNNTSKVSIYNDDVWTSHADVIALFDRAIDKFARKWGIMLTPEEAR